jgi:hypothetical protein
LTTPTSSFAWPTEKWGVEQMARECWLEHDTPTAATHTFNLELEGHETKTDIAVCRDHGQHLYDHNADDFGKQGAATRLADLRPYVEDKHTVMEYRRIPPERPPHEIGHSLGLEREI